MPTVLVTGASGFVASHVIPELLEGGHRVVALVHRPDDGPRVLGRLPAAHHSAVDVRVGDVTMPGSLVPALATVDAVVHLVALPRDWNGGRDLVRVNVGGTENVLDAMQAAGVRRLVHLGALGVVDDPALHYASSKARAEALVAASGLDWTILKPSVLWGERDGFFNTIAGLVRLSPGVVPVPGDGRSRFQPLAAADLAHAVRLSLDDAAHVGQSHLLGGPRFWTYRQITTEVCRAMGRRRVVLPMPVPVIRLVAAAAERLHAPFPVATDQLRQLGLDNVTELDAVERAFGFAPRDMAGSLGYLRRRIGQQEPAAGPVDRASR